MAHVSKGSVYRQKGSENGFIKFYVDGELKRETTGTTNREAAFAVLKRRTEEAALGRYTDVSQRITWSEMRALLLEDYRYKGNRTDPVPRLARLTESFGKCVGDDLTATRIKEYSKRRLAAGAAPATLRRELAILKRMLRLASERLPRMPLIVLPPVHNARQGFFEESDLQRILPHLPEHARNLVEFLFLTGWRSGEAFALHWSDVDWKRKTVFLRDSKNREPRVFPFKYHPRLEVVLLRQRDAVTRWERTHGRLCPTVFHWRGRGLKKIRRAWLRACELAGMPGRLIHDFRRTAVRNLIRAGVQQAIAMKITGHKADSIFRRYLIVDEELLAQATGAVADLLGPGEGPDKPSE